MKHNTEPDTFQDYWEVYIEDEWTGHTSAKEAATQRFDTIMQWGKEDNNEWHLWTATVGKIVDSTEAY